MTRLLTFPSVLRPWHGSWRMFWMLLITLQTRTRKHTHTHRTIHTHSWQAQQWTRNLARLALALPLSCTAHMFLSLSLSPASTSSHLFLLSPLFTLSSYLSLPSLPLTHFDLNANTVKIKWSNVFALLLLQLPPEQQLGSPLGRGLALLLWHILCTHISLYLFSLCIAKFSHEIKR